MEIVYKYRENQSWVLCVSIFRGLRGKLDFLLNRLNIPSFSHSGRRRWDAVVRPTSDDQKRDAGYVGK